MYVGIDIGGTKTLVAALTNEGRFHESLKFLTPADYNAFIEELRSNFAKLATKDFRAGAVAAPGLINREKGLFRCGGNLKWTDEPLLRDIERITQCPMLLENDAKLAALSEAMLVKDKHSRVLYVTISTGIGGGFIVDQQIVQSMADTEVGHMMLQRGDKLVKWESFASGRAIYERYGQKASEITDKAIWQSVAKDLAVGFINLLAVFQPDLIVVGGGVGHYLEKYHDLLMDELKRFPNPMVPIVPIVKAQRPNEAVVYGCYDLARSRYS